MADRHPLEGHRDFFGSDHVRVLLAVIDGLGDPESIGVHLTLPEQRVRSCLAQLHERELVHWPRPRQSATAHTRFRKIEGDEHANLDDGVVGADGPPTVGAPDRDREEDDRDEVVGSA